MANQNNNQQTGTAGVTPPNGTPPAPPTGSTPPAGNGAAPPAPGIAANATAPQNNGTVATPQNTGDNKPPAASPPAQGSGTKKRVKCAALKGQQITVGSELMQADAEGIIEVSVEQAKRLLTIPGYEEA